MRNQNDENGKSAERGTNNFNGMDGCRIPARAGNVNILIPPPFGPEVLEGGPCCASNTYLTIGPFSGYLPNDCCNPPEFLFGIAVPGNHCLCFELRF